MSIRHDYKSASIGQRRQRARRYGLLVMTLVLIGLFGSLLAYIKGDRTQPAPAVASVAPVTPAQPPATPPPPKTVAAAGAEEPALVKPKYDFYTELPKRHIPIQHEIVNPKNAHLSLPNRMQPAADSHRKPAIPHKNAAVKPTVATANSAKPNAEPANAKPANAKSTNAKAANARSANAEPVNAKAANAKSANAEPVTAKSANAKALNAKSANIEPTTRPANAKSANVKSANAKPESATTPARATQPPKPLANTGSKVVVKTE